MKSLIYAMEREIMENEIFEVCFDTLEDMTRFKHLCVKHGASWKEEHVPDFGNNFYFLFKPCSSIDRLKVIRAITECEILFGDKVREY